MKYRRVSFYVIAFIIFIRSFSKRKKTIRQFHQRYRSIWFPTFYARNFRPIYLTYQPGFLINSTLKAGCFNPKQIISFVFLSLLNQSQRNLFPNMNSPPPQVCIARGLLALIPLFSFTCKCNSFPINQKCLQGCSTLQNPKLSCMHESSLARCSN